MTGLVIDASVALSWCFADEASEAGDAALDRVIAEGALVPQHWHLEVANVLCQGEKRGRIDLPRIRERLQLLAELTVTIDQEAGRRAWNEVFYLARAHGLTVYDAAYAELAQRSGRLLASKDKQLLSAAHQMGVETLAI
jgi:predicted nucleic acid-binding protein